MLRYHIQTVRVPSGGSSAITISGIPQIYDDLYVVMSLRGTSISAGNQALMRINVSSSNFTVRALYTSSAGNGATYSDTTGAVGTYSGSDNTANAFHNGDILITNYATSSAKTFSSDAVFGNMGYSYLIFNSGVWNNSSAITSLSFVGTDSSSTWVENSSISLYGIRRGADGVTNGAATGGTITTSGGFTIHTFTGSGTFTANRTLDVEYLVCLSSSKILHTLIQQFSPNVSRILSLLQKKILKHINLHSKILHWAKFLTSV